MKKAKKGKKAHRGKPQFNNKKAIKQRRQDRGNPKKKHMIKK